MTTLQLINKAIKALQTKGIKPTQSAVAKESGYSVRTIKRHWKDRVTEQGDAINDRVTPDETIRVILPVKQGDTVKPSTAFERLKERKRINETIPYRPCLKP